MNELAWTTDDVAAYLKVAPRTVARWRQGGAGPPWHRLDSGTIRYVPQEVRDWLAAKEGS